ncbi:MAG: YVTN family beta-propeller protein [Pseudohongiellaceae bacterium]|jgi:YVTN family beta-propeller protein
MVVVAPDQPRAFVANISEGSLTVIDIDKGELLKTIPTGGGCEGIDITPDGKQVWTTNRAANTLSIVDAHSLDVTGEISCGDFPIRLKFTPDGQRSVVSCTVVSCAVSAEVVVLDVNTHAELARVPLTLHIVDDAGERLFGEAMAQTPAPVGVLIAPTGSRAYIAATNADRVVVLDLESYELVGSLITGSQPDGLGWAHLVGITGLATGSP